MAKPTASDKGKKRDCAGPVMKNDGRNTAMTLSHGEQAGSCHFTAGEKNGVSRSFAAIQMNVNVFQQDVLRPPARRQQERGTEGHDVNGLPGKLEQNDGRKKSERNRNHDDQRRPPVAQEQEQRQPGEERLRLCLRARPTSTHRERTAIDRNS